MARFDDFDLDVNVNKGAEKETRIASKSLCTPGSCYTFCKPTSTFGSNCCI